MINFYKFYYVFLCIDYDDCENNECIDGKCIDGIGDYTCDCNGTGYVGKLCENGNISFNLFVCFLCLIWIHLKISSFILIMILKISSYIYMHKYHVN